MKETNCKKCKAKQTVGWFADEQIFMCSACGWIDKNRNKDDKTSSN